MGDSLFNQESEIAKLNDRHQVPEGRQSWSQLPGRSYMKRIASSTTSPKSQLAPVYELGKAICTDIATNISLPLPQSIKRGNPAEPTSITNMVHGRSLLVLYVS